MSANLHNDNFHAWTQQQAALLRDGRLQEANLPHLIEEIEMMGASERRELVNWNLLRTTGNCHRIDPLV
ncbi:MAG: DUF29 domain-containing protein [Methylotetracoccus sp.]|jgi:hypothetical protein|nr:DUF29 domain-containing protein [Methylotetracoccus sp.]